MEPLRAIVVALLLLMASGAACAARTGSILLVDTRGGSTTFDRALGTGHKVLLITKPWVDANAQLIGDLVHYRIRLNRGGLRSAVIFLRSAPGEAARVVGEALSKLSVYVDPDGRLAGALEIHSLPAVVLVAPDGTVKFQAPLVSRELVRQVAQHYARADTLLQTPKPAPPARPGIPDPAGGNSRYIIR